MGATPGVGPDPEAASLRQLLDDSATRRRPVRVRSLALVVTAAGLIVAVVFGLSVARGRSAQRESRSSRPAAERRPARTPSSSPVAPPASPPPVVEVGGRRYEIGQAGDVAVAQGSDCDGTPAVAVLRPATGSVFVFDAWATAGRDERGHLAGRAPGATSLRLDDLDGDGCLDAIAEDRGGRLVPIAPAQEG